MLNAFFFYFVGVLGAIKLCQKGSDLTELGNPFEERRINVIVLVVDQNVFFYLLVFNYGIFSFSLFILSFDIGFRNALRRI